MSSGELSDEAERTGLGNRPSFLVTRERPLGAHGARPQVKPKKVHFPFEGIYDDSSRNPPEDGVPTKYRKEVWEDAVMEASTARLLSLGASQEVTLPRPFLWRRPRRRALTLLVCLCRTLTIRNGVVGP